MENSRSEHETSSHSFQTKTEGSDRAPVQFLRIGGSQDRKWVFLDFVTRHIVHFNYLDTILKSRRGVPQENPPGADLPLESAVDQPAPSKGKRARKENDRTS